MPDNTAIGELAAKYLLERGHKHVAYLSSGFGSWSFEIRSLAFAPDNITLAATGDRVIHLWNANTGHAMLGTEQRTRVKPTVSLSAAGALMASNASGRQAARSDKK